MSSTRFNTRLLHWFDQHGRKDLPWQHPITPYRVWVSEIMLQQTQVDTVIPYFERFMKRFPSVDALAGAPLDEVLHLWTGLGYYARARNLHKCAQAVVAQFGGEFPAEADTLAQLPGIGRSTAAAIASIAFNQPSAILDGNVKRVLARHGAIAGWPGRTEVAERLWRQAEDYMPLERCRDYTQAIMDLGATLCTRSKPRCKDCPVQADCQAFAEGNPAAYPGSKPKKPKPVRQAYLLILQTPEGKVFLQQRPESGIWGGLWSLPELDVAKDPKAHAQQHYGPVDSVQSWTSLRHSFSHYHFDIHPVHIVLAQTHSGVREQPQAAWLDLRESMKIGLAAPIKALLARLQPAHPQQQMLAL